MKMGKRSVIDPSKITKSTSPGETKSPTATNPIQNPAGVVENRPVAVQVAVKRAIVDSEYVPLSHLIVHTEGDVWKVDYFRQKVGMDDKPQALQVGMSGVEQQYELTKGYELRVDTPLDQNQDPQSKEFTVTGDASVVYGLIPNFGDMFIADIGNGESGIFAVEGSERLTYQKQSAYKIRYRLVAETGGDWEEDLLSKVVTTYYFRRDMIERQDSPFMTEEAQHVYVSLTEHEKRLEQMFLDKFWSKGVRGLRVPNQTHAIYDGFHSSFCRRIGLRDTLRSIPFYSLGHLDNEDANSFWELFEDFDKYKFYNLNRDFGIITCKSLPGTHIERTVAWSPYSECIYPKVGSYFDIDNEKFYGHYPNGKENWENATPEGYAPQRLSERLEAANNLQLRHLYYPVSLEPYIVSEAFYEQRGVDMSVMELMLYKALCGESISADIVAELFDGIYKEPLLSQFYYIPLLLVLKEYLTYGSDVA